MSADRQPWVCPHCRGCDYEPTSTDYDSLCVLCGGVQYSDAIADPWAAQR